jgi:hypothetical protein
VGSQRRYEGGERARVGLEAPGVSSSQWQAQALQRRGGRRSSGDATLCSAARGAGELSGGLALSTLCAFRIV